MNRTRSAALLAVVLAAAGSSAALAAGAPASAGSSPAPFTLTVHRGSEATIDLGRHGFSAGDQDLYTCAVTAGGRSAGRLVGSCTTVRVATTADQLCEFVLRLGSAQLTAAGVVSSGPGGPGTFDLPVLGGTGKYAGAGGQIAVTASNGKSFPITVTLQ
jgi:hypothetical protein